MEKIKKFKNFYQENVRKQFKRHCIVITHDYKVLKGLLRMSASGWNNQWQKIL